MATQTRIVFAIELLLLMLCRCSCWGHTPQILYVLDPFEGEPLFHSNSWAESDRHHCCSMEAAVVTAVVMAGFAAVLSFYAGCTTRKQGAACWEGKKLEPEAREVVTVLFADIVGFTNISSHLDPLKISDMLDRLYRRFDALSIKHDVFKMETVGDCWMGATNLIKDQPDHVKRITDFSSDVIKASQETLIDVDDVAKGSIQIRVGFHSGPVVGRFIGTRNPRYCLFGDSVNIASRMESNCAPGRIHCSKASANLLRAQDPAAKITPRGAIEIKGKGLMQTYWINDVEPVPVVPYSKFNSPV